MRILKTHGFPNSSWNFLSSVIMFSFCFQRDLASSFTKDFSERNRKLPLNIEWQTSAKLQSHWSWNFSAKTIESFQETINSNFYRSSSNLCLTGSVTFASYVNGRIFLSENKILCEFFQAAIFANFEQLITGGVVEAAFVLTRMSLQKQKVSQYPQNLLFFHLWAIASGLVFCILFV